MTMANKPMTKCRYADKYKAVKAPTCGCDMCRLKWEIAKIYRWRKDNV
jgi:hypothetical protein